MFSDGYVGIIEKRTTPCNKQVRFVAYEMILAELPLSTDYGYSNKSCAKQLAKCQTKVD